MLLSVFACNSWFILYMAKPTNAESDKVKAKSGKICVGTHTVSATVLSISGALMCVHGMMAVNVDTPDTYV